MKSKKRNFSLVEPTLEDDLEKAIAAEAELSNKLAVAEAEFKERFPGDARIFSHNLPQMDPKRDEYQGAYFGIEQLRREQQKAKKALEDARRRIDQHGSETDKRGLLANAIAAQTETAKVFKIAEDAFARASETVRTWQKKYEDSVAEFASARDRHVQDAVQSATTGEPLSAGSMAEARSMQADALDHLEAAKAALGKMQERLAQAAAAHRDAETAVSRYADGVIMTAAVHDLMVRARSLMEDLVKVRLALRYLDEAGLVLDVDREEVIDILQDADLPRRSSDWDVEWDDDAAAAPWKKTREALTHDAQAPMPKV